MLSFASRTTKATSWVGSSVHIPVFFVFFCCYGDVRKQCVFWSEVAASTQHPVMTDKDQIDDSKQLLIPIYTLVCLLVTMSSLLMLLEKFLCEKNTKTGQKGPIWLFKVSVCVSLGMFLSKSLGRLKKEELIRLPGSQHHSWLVCCWPGSRNQK